jgi:hypothetical protein
LYVVPWDAYVVPLQTPGQLSCRCGTKPRGRLGVHSGEGLCAISRCRFSRFHVKAVTWSKKEFYWTLLLCSREQAQSSRRLWLVGRELAYDNRSRTEQFGLFDDDGMAAR